MIGWLLRGVSRLPLPLLYAVSDGLAGVLMYLVRYRRAVIVRNLAVSFPEKTSARSQRISSGLLP